MKISKKLKILLGTAGVVTTSAAVGVGIYVANTDSNRRVKSVDTPNASTDENAAANNNSGQDASANNNNTNNSNNQNTNQNDNEVPIDKSIDETLITDDIKYLAFGDSIVAGFNSKLAKDYPGELTVDNDQKTITGLSYPSFIAQFINEIEANRLAAYKNFGITSSTTKQWNQLFENSNEAGLRIFWKDDYEAKRKDFLARLADANLLTISLGANDFIELLLNGFDFNELIKKLNAPENSTRELIEFASSLLSNISSEINKRYQKLIKNIRKVNPKVTINFVSYPMPLLRLKNLIDNLTANLSLGTGTLSEFLLDSLNGIAKSLMTSDDNMQYINVFNKRTWGEDANYLSDAIFDIHPSEHGYKKMAQEVFLKLTINRTNYNSQELEKLNSDWDKAFTASDFLSAKKKIVFEDVEENSITNQILGLDHNRDLLAEARIQKYSHLFNVNHFSRRVLNALINKTYLRFGLEFLKNNETFSSSDEMRNFVDFLLKDDAQNLTLLINPIVESDFFVDLINDVQKEVDATTLDKKTPISKDLLLGSLKKALSNYDRYIPLLKAFLNSEFIKNKEKAKELKAVFVPLVESLINNEALRSLITPIFAGSGPSEELAKNLSEIIEKYNLTSKVGKFVGALFDDLVKNRENYLQIDSLSSLLTAFLKNNQEIISELLSDIFSDLLKNQEPQVKKVLISGIKVLNQKYNLSLNEEQIATLKSFVLENLKIFNDAKVINRVLKTLLKTLEPEANSETLINSFNINLFINRFLKDDLLPLLKYFSSHSYFQDQEKKENYKNLLKKTIQIILSNNEIGAWATNLLNRTLKLNLDEQDQENLANFIQSLTSTEETSLFVSNMIDIFFNNLNAISETKSANQLLVTVLTNSKEVIVTYLKYLFKKLNDDPAHSTILKIISQQISLKLMPLVQNFSPQSQKALQKLIQGLVSVLTDDSFIDQVYDLFLVNLANIDSEQNLVSQLLGLPSAQKFEEQGLASLNKFFELLKNPALKNFLKEEATINNLKIIINDLLSTNSLNGLINNLEIASFNEELNQKLQSLLRALVNESQLVENLKSFSFKLIDKLDLILEAPNVIQALQKLVIETKEPLGAFLKNLVLTLFKKENKEDFKLILKAFLENTNLTQSFDPQFFSSALNLVFNNSQMLLSEANLDKIINTSLDYLEAHQSFNFQELLQEILKALVPNYNSEAPFAEQLDSIYLFVKPLLNNLITEKNENDFKIVIKALLRSDLIGELVAQALPLEAQDLKASALPEIFASIFSSLQSANLVDSIISNLFSNKELYLEKDSFQLFLKTLLINNQEAIVSFVETLFQSLSLSQNARFEAALNRFIPFIFSKLNLQLSLEENALVKQFVHESLRTLSTQKSFQKIISDLVTNLDFTNLNVININLNSEDIFSLLHSLLNDSQLLNNPQKRNKLLKIVAKVVEKLFHDQSAQKFLKDALRNLIVADSSLASDLNKIVDFIFNLPNLNTFIKQIIDAFDLNFDTLKEAQNFPALIKTLFKASKATIINLIQEISNNNQLTTILDPLTNLFVANFLKDLDLNDEASAKFKKATKALIHDFAKTLNSSPFLEKIIHLAMDHLLDIEALSLSQIKKVLKIEANSEIAIIWHLINSFINDPGINRLLNNQDFLDNLSLVIGTLAKAPSLQNLVLNNFTLGAEFSNLDSDFKELLKTVLNDLDFPQIISIFKEFVQSQNEVDAQSIFAALVNFIKSSKTKVAALIKTTLTESNLFTNTHLLSLVKKTIPLLLSKIEVTLAQSEVDSLAQNLTVLASKINNQKVLEAIIDLVAAYLEPLAQNENLNQQQLLSTFSQNLDPFNLIKATLATFQSLNTEDKQATKLALKGIIKTISKGAIISPLLSSALDNNFLANSEDKRQFNNLVTEVTSQNYFSDFVNRLVNSVVETQIDFSQINNLNSLFRKILFENKAIINTFAKHLFATIASSSNNKFLIDFSLTQLSLYLNSKNIVLSQEMIKKAKAILPSFFRIISQSNYISSIITLVHNNINNQSESQSTIKGFSFDQIFSVISSKEGLLELVKAISSSNLLNNQNFINQFKEKLWDLIRVTIKDSHFLASVLKLALETEEINVDALRSVTDIIADSNEAHELFITIFDLFIVNKNRALIARSTSFDDLLLKALHQLADQNNNRFRNALKNLMKFVLKQDSADFETLIKMITTPLLKNTNLGITEADASRYAPFFAIVLRQLPSATKIFDTLVDGVLNGLRTIDALNQEASQKLLNTILDTLKSLAFNNYNQIQLSKIINLLPEIQTFTQAEGFGKALADFINLLFDKSDFQRKDGIYKIIYHNLLPAYALPEALKNNQSEAPNANSATSVSVDVHDAIFSGAFANVYHFIKNLSKAFADSFMKAILAEVKRHPETKIEYSQAYKGMFRFNILMQLFFRQNIGSGYLWGAFFKISPWWAEGVLNAAQEFYDANPEIKQTWNIKTHKTFSDFLVGKPITNPWYWFDRSVANYHNNNPLITIFYVAEEERAYTKGVKQSDLVNNIMNWLKKGYAKKARREYDYN